MDGQHTARHALSLRLTYGWPDDIFQLHRIKLGSLGRIVVTTFETERSVTLVCNNLYHVAGKSRKLGLLEALKSGLVELVESGKDDVIWLPPTATQQLGQLIILPKPSPRHGQVEISVYIDTISSEWKEILQPGQTYEMRFSKSR
jgi:hypothetical protein